jgi:hypothetical protein
MTRRIRVEDKLAELTLSRDDADKKVADSSGKHDGAASRGE